MVVHFIWLNTWKWLLYASLIIALLIIFNILLYICYGVKVKYSRNGYVITDDEIIIRWGTVWHDSSSIIPLSRVQHVDMEQDLIAKRYGISEIAIHTAGDAHYIVGLLKHDAEKVRRQVIQAAKLEDCDAYND